MKHAKDDDGQNPCPVRGVSLPKRKMSCLINTFLTTVHLEDNSWSPQSGDQVGGRGGVPCVKTGNISIKESRRQQTSIN